MPLEAVFQNLETLVNCVASDETNINQTSHGNSKTIQRDEIVCGRTLQHESTMSSIKTNSVAIKNKRYLMKKKWKSANHVKVNDSERKRRERLTTNIQKLKELIPTSPEKMQTKESILEEAIKYIINLKEEMDNMLKQDASEVILTEMNTLRKKVSELEKERVLYIRVLQTHGLMNSLNCKKMPIPRFHPKLKTVLTSQSVDNCPENCFQVQSKATTSFRKSSQNDKVASFVSSSCLEPLHQPKNNEGEPSLRSDKKCNTNCDISNTNCEKEQPFNTFLSTRLCSVVPTAFSITDASPAPCCAPSVSSTNCSGETILFPSINTLYGQSNKAFCTPTYSVARMDAVSKHKNVKLPSVVVEAVREKPTSSQCQTKKRSLDRLVDITVQSRDFTTVNVNLETTVSSPCTSDYAVVSAVATSSCSINCVAGSTNTSETPPSAKSTNTICICSSDSSIPTPDVYNTTSVESLHILLESINSKNNANSHALHTSSAIPTTDNSLRSWLSSQETSEADKGITSKPPVSVTLFSQTAIGESSPNNVAHETKTLSKKATKSFNIANLMKSKEAITSSSCWSISKTSSYITQTNLSKDSSFFLLSADSSDINVGPSKDIFPSSFETEFFDCLQSMPNLPAPELSSKPQFSKVDAFVLNTPCNLTFPGGIEDSYLDTSHSLKLFNSENISAPDQQSRKQRVSLASVDLNDIQPGNLYPMSYRTTLHEKSAEHGTMAQNCSNLPPHCFENYVSGSSSTFSNVFKNSQTAISSKHCYSSSSTSSVNSTAVPLWQPAITSAPSSRQIVSSAQSMPDCFSPLAYSYINGNTPRLAQNLHSGTQTLHEFNSHSAWASQASQRETYAVETPAKISNHSAVEETKTRKLHALKKRKTSLNVTQPRSKRRSHAKSAMQVTQKESHSIPQLVGYQHPAKPPQQPQALITHTRALLHPTGIDPSCANNSSNNYNSNERGPMFGSNTNGVMCPRGVGYGTDYAVQSNIFHSPSAVPPQTPSYHTPHGSYHFPYNHSSPHPHQQPAKHMYMPRFSNTNNSNNAALSGGVKLHKTSQSQHHIRQILS